MCLSEREPSVHPSLPRHYPASTVLRRTPTSCGSSAGLCLRSPSHTLRATRGNPQDLPGCDIHPYRRAVPRTPVDPPALALRSESLSCKRWNLPASGMRSVSTCVFEADMASLLLPPASFLPSCLTHVVTSMSLKVDSPLLWLWSRWGGIFTLWMDAPCPGAPLDPPGS